jgi:hypothetical protein
MTSATRQTILILLGVVIMTIAGQTLSHRVGATWELAAFAVGILFVATAGRFLFAERIAALEKRVADLERARSGQ